MKSSGSWRVLLDCSTFISAAIYSPGKPRQILYLWQQEKINLLVSTPIIEEYEKKLIPVATRMRKDLLIAQLYLELIKTESTIVTAEKVNLKICRDPNDIKYLEAAAGGMVDFLVSSDKDLLILKKFKKTKIVTPDEFLKKLSTII